MVIVLTSSYKGFSRKVTGMMGPDQSVVTPDVDTKIVSLITRLTWATTLQND